MNIKKYYLTKYETGNLWNYVGDPINPNTTFDVGLIEVNTEEIRVDQFGSYVTRYVQPEITFKDLLPKDFKVNYQIK